MDFNRPTDSIFVRSYPEELEMLLSAIDCVLDRERAIYCSSELTSGRRLQCALRERRMRTGGELRQSQGEEWFQREIQKPNERAAMEFAEAVRHILNDRTIVITPAPFRAAPKHDGTSSWNQSEYLFFWEKIIRTRIKSAWFNDNWQYSSGCAFEFAVAVDAGVPTFDRQGTPLSAASGVNLLRAAVAQIESEGCDVSTLKESLERICMLTGTFSYV